MLHLRTFSSCGSCAGSCGDRMGNVLRFWIHRMTIHEQNEEQLDSVQVENTTSPRQPPLLHERTSGVRSQHHLVLVKRDVPDVI